MIAQQRKLAALLSKKSQQSDDLKRPQASGPAESSKRASTEGALKRPIRPTLKRPGNASALAALAAARAKAASKTAPEATMKDEPEIIEVEDSPQLQRKKKAVDTNRLASLVKNVSAASRGDGDDTSAAFGSNVTPADFWRNIREWDFVSDLANLNNDKDESSLNTRKSIPETFISFRHYISLWAPLCLAEARAQLMSELMTTSNQQRSKARLFVEVEVETTWTGGGRKDRHLHTDLIDMDSCSVRIRNKVRNQGQGQYYANDVFCLVPTECKDTVELLINGKKIADNDHSFKRFCIVGHTEYQRKDLNGLVLKVSKRKWAQIGTSTMFLMKIGANITALREFTALCGVETIPLKRYLLGHHLNEMTGSLSSNETADNRSVTMSRSAQVKKDSLLKKMGGVEALGKGFTEYARKKFNASQLMAISASSTGYGEGEHLKGIWSSANWPSRTSLF